MDGNKAQDCTDNDLPSFQRCISIPAAKLASVPSEDRRRCGICLGDFLTKDISQPPCGHPLCHACLVTLIITQPEEPEEEDDLPFIRRCPLCRATVIPFEINNQAGLRTKADVSKFHWCRDCFKILCHAHAKPEKTGNERSEEEEPKHPSDHVLESFNYATAIAQIRKQLTTQKLEMESFSKNLKVASEGEFITYTKKMFSELLRQMQETYDNQDYLKEYSFFQVSDSFDNLKERADWCGTVLNHFDFFFGPDENPKAEPAPEMAIKDIGYVRHPRAISAIFEKKFYDYEDIIHAMLPVVGEEMQDGLLAGGGYWAHGWLHTLTDDYAMIKRFESDETKFKKAISFIIERFLKGEYNQLDQDVFCQPLEALKLLERKEREAEEEKRLEEERKKREEEEDRQAAEREREREALRQERIARGEPPDTPEPPEPEEPLERPYDNPPERPAPSARVEYEDDSSTSAPVFLLHAPEYKAAVFVETGKGQRLLVASSKQGLFICDKDLAVVDQKFRNLSFGSIASNSKFVFLFQHEVLKEGTYESELKLHVLSVESQEPIKVFDTTNLFRTCPNRTRLTANEQFLFIIEGENIWGVEIEVLMNSGTEALVRSLESGDENSEQAEERTISEPWLKRILTMESDYQHDSYGEGLHDCAASKEFLFLKAVVNDAQNNAVLVFDLEGNFVRRILRSGSEYAITFRSSDSNRGLCLDDRGNVIIFGYNGLEMFEAATGVYKGKVLDDERLGYTTYDSYILARQGCIFIIRDNTVQKFFYDTPGPLAAPPAVARGDSAMFDGETEPELKN